MTGKRPRKSAIAAKINTKRINLLVIMISPASLATFYLPTASRSIKYSGSPILAISFCVALIL
jgi:hypothetical protein